MSNDAAKKYLVADKSNKDMFDQDLHKTDSNAKLDIVIKDEEEVKHPTF